MQFICRKQPNFFQLQSSAIAARNSGAVLAPREWRQPHYQIMAGKERDKAFDLNLWETLLQRIPNVIIAPHPLTPYPPCVSLSACTEMCGVVYLYSRMLQCDDDVIIAMMCVTGVA